jgi:hypothetical protein
VAVRQSFPADVESALLAAIELAGPLLRSGRRTPESLAEVLYSGWYTAIGEPKSLQLTDHSPPFLGLLSASHAGSQRWESGWRAERVSSAGRVQAMRNDERRLLAVTEYVSEDRPGIPPRPGAGIVAIGRRASTRLVPGFWVTHTAAWSMSSEPRVRLYWNVTPAGAPALVRELTERLDPDIPYALKFPVEPELFNRCDAAVLYLSGREFDAARDPVRRAHAAVLRDLADDVPKLTRRLATGLGLVEDSSNPRESFGTSRCRIVAEVLVEGSTRGLHSPTLLLGAIARRFSNAGISAAMPYLRDKGPREYAI